MKTRSTVYSDCLVDLLGLRVDLLGLRAIAQGVTTRRKERRDAGLEQREAEKIG